ncbi:phage minor head protein [Xanthobacteraceae bacterium Astr-EGSB]|uniref:phage head morphogenesis protein n=1 Tax=Astrobacterium formosum TaxID=3069710 RepID=UPI0027B4AB2D|nr:phage minor head protein [Xanthobacteraceae bacterium Astr-EGSB]
MRACHHCGGFALGAAEAVPFAVDPQEAIDFLRRKIDLPTQAWTDIWQEMHSRAFVVAGAQSEALLADFHEAVNRAIAEGRTLAQFRADFDHIVATHGWSYKGSRAWRSRVIFQTNLRMAYAAGRWEQIQRVKKTRPYLRYVAVMDARVRPLHAEWHDTVLPVDDPWWQTHFPPNGWNCRCSVMSLNERDLARYGLKVSERAPDVVMEERTIRTAAGARTIQVPRGIDPGFAYRPGALPPRDDGGVPPTPPPAPPLSVQFSGSVSDDFRRRVSDAVAALPSQVTDKLRSSGITIHAAARITDIIAEAGTPRGWPAGSTYANLDGLFQSRLQGDRVIVAETYLSRTGRWQATDRTIGVINHEIGHALDRAVGDASHGEAFGLAYHTDLISQAAGVAAVDRYFLQAGVAGRQETFAEIFAQLQGRGTASKIPSLLDLFPRAAAFVRTLLESL